ncbi:MAG: hypothetical protein D6798_03995 [Deltaproteobacteria bacterium]|nr:MAG: hypothetical protein D6798_03995 [Deltaproteobacteria bacterium]
MAITSLLLAATLLAACGDKGDGGSDSGSADGGISDGGSADGGTADGGGADGGSADGGSADEDRDQDGYVAGRDCDDTNPDVHPGATEVCNGVDDDCNDLVDDNARDMVTMYPDMDGDGYGNPLAGQQFCPDDIPAEGYVDNDADCRDSDASVNPDGTEICDDDNRDEDCDGLRDDEDPNTHPDSMSTFYADMDLDGYGDRNRTIQGCDAGDIRALNNIDCDDSNPEVGPDSTCAPWDGSWVGALDVSVEGVYGYSGTCDDTGTVIVSDASSVQVTGTVTCNYYDYYPVTLTLYGTIDYPWDVTGYWQDTMNWWDGAGGETSLSGQFSADGSTLVLELHGLGDFLGYEVTADGTWTVTR